MRLPFLELLSDSLLITSLWLSREDGYECPYNKPMTQNHDSGYASCTCESHCSWHKCRLFQAPNECLAGTRSVWFWDVQRGYWVGQEVKGANMSR